MLLRVASAGVAVALVLPQCPRKDRIDPHPVSVAAEDAAPPAEDPAKHADLEVQRRLEPKVVSGAATPDEVRLLTAACTRLGDSLCVAQCELADPPVDSGARPGAAIDAGTSLAQQAKQLALTDPDAAKRLLLPIVVRGKGSAEEVRQLRAICKGLGDTVCVALCDHKKR